MEQLALENQAHTSSKRADSVEPDQHISSVVT
jgi:hypothetical protein